jgi:uncharacterized protein YndB with AHSA1/START domain
MENDFEPHVGHKFQFRTQSLPGLDSVIHCEVLEIDAPKRLSYTWRDNYMSQPSIVIWTLIPVDGGTQLQLEHRQLNYEAPKLIKPERIPAQQGLFRHELTQITQTLAAIAPSKVSHGKYETFESVIFHSWLNGGWNERLDRQLPNILVSLTIDNQ